MSSTIRASAPGPLAAKVQTAALTRPNVPAGSMLRFDRPHGACHALRGPLEWTDYVQPPAYPAVPSDRASGGARHRLSDGAMSSQSAASAITAAELQQVSRADKHAPVLRTLERDRDVPLGLHRQRFYPEQWKRLQQQTLDQLVKSHGQRLQWVGWERSLPQLYLPPRLLTRAILDLLGAMLQTTPASSTPDEAISLRVAWQIGSVQALVIVLEHPKRELSATLAQSLGARVTDSRGLSSKRFSGQSSGAERSNGERSIAEQSGADRVLQVRNLLESIGGSLGVVPCPHGGAQFRLSVPVDDRMTLVRTWLEHAVRATVPSQPAAGPAGAPAATASHMRSGHRSRPAPVVYQSQIRMFVLGRAQAETIEALARADASLQALSGRGDFVYRAAHSRWLWLTLHSHLPALAARDGWQSQLVSCWDCLFDAATISEQQSTAFHGLARAIAARMESVLGRRVPPLDVLNVPAPRSRQLRVDSSSTVRPLGPARQPARGSQGVVAASSMRQRRWRYPI